ncbi:MAG: hypothetical protein ACSHW2_06990, partial [Parasphingopyxis sp.]
AVVQPNAAWADVMIEPLFAALAKVGGRRTVVMYGTGRARSRVGLEEKTDILIGSVDAAIAASPLLPFDVQDGNVKINLRAGIGAADESWALEAWVTNLTNEMTRGVTFSTTLRSGSRSAFPQEPRLFGVTLRSRF